MTTLVFEDPPSPPRPGRPRALSDEAIEALRSRPMEWALFTSRGSAGAARAVARRVSGYAPDDIELSVLSVRGGARVYIRSRGEGS